MPEIAPRANADHAPGLYIIATPIGNLGDLTRRALSALGSMDMLACEDTRTTQKLLQAHGLSAPELVAYHEHNAEEARPKILRRLAEGKRVGLVSEAGTPLISDPGYKLVVAVAGAGIPIIPLPGACAPIAALMAAGLPTDQFHFAGFLPTKNAARLTALEACIPIPGTLAFFESPNRLVDTLEAMVATFGPERPACVARELTKRFEEFRRGTLGELAAQYRSAETPKGELVILVGPAPAGLEEAFAPSPAMMALAKAARAGGMKQSELAEHLATLTEQAKKPIYQWLLSWA